MTRILQNKWNILFAVLIAWFPVLFVSFLNDDFQILGYHSSGNFLSIFAPFWQQDVSVFYWRPVGNILHPFMMMLFGFSPLPYRILSILLYFICCWVLASFIEETGVKREYAVLTGILFAVLPSHEYQVAWIADQGESLVTIFLLLVFIFYKKNKAVSLLWFVAAVLTKESAFAGIFIPFIYFILDKEKYSFKQSIRDGAIAFAIIIILQLYRYFIIGGTPFSSSNFEGTNPVKWISNFFTYLPISFVQPEVLDIIISFGVINSPVLLIIGFILLAVLFFYTLYMLVITYPKLTPVKKRIFLAGLAWFVFFILPALPKFMRWYVFTASAGLMLSTAVFFEAVDVKKYFRHVVFAIIIILGVIDFKVLTQWKSNSDKMEDITESLKIVNGQDPVFIFTVPEKIKNVPLMKLGIGETVRYASKVNDLDVFAVLRAEFFSDNPTVNIKTENDSVKIFTTADGRFKNREGRSYPFINQENFSYTEEGMKIEIINGTFDGKILSRAKVTIPKHIKAQNLYYNGSAFIPF